MKKINYTKKGLWRYYPKLLHEIITDAFKEFEYKTVLSCPVNKVDWFRCNDSFIELCMYDDLVGLIGKYEIGRIHGKTIEINKKGELVIKIKKLEKK